MTENENKIQDLLEWIEASRMRMHDRIDQDYDAMCEYVLTGKMPKVENLRVQVTHDTERLKSTKPTAVTLPDGTVIPVRSWIAAIQTVLRDCCMDPTMLSHLRMKCDRLYGNKRLLLSSHPEELDRPVEIATGLFFEAKMDTGALWKYATENSSILPDMTAAASGSHFRIPMNHQ